jgi:serine phosphatase RsbU (regulator of sigma subunit)
MKNSNHKRILFICAFILTTVYSAYSQKNQDNNIQQNIEDANRYMEDGDKAEAARLYNRTAYMYRTSGKLELAITYYQKVLDLNTELGNTVGQMLTHSNLSMLYIELGQYNEALAHLEAELGYRERNKKIQEIIPVLVSIGGVRNELGQFEQAMEYTQRAIDLSLETNDLFLLKRSYGMAYDIYNKWGKTKEAQSFFEKYSAIDKKIKEDRMAEVESDAKQKVSVANIEKEKTQKELQQTTEHLEEAERLAQQQKLELDLQQALINEKNALLEVEIVKKRYFAAGFIITLIFVLVLAFLVFRIRKANKKINLQASKLEKQNREIKSSIRYANTIQTAMLPDLVQIKDFATNFVIYRPKDIVSGDFYWASIISDTRMFFAVVDCTGHGVPGAFMSMIGIRMLDEIVNEMKLESPAIILESLNEILRTALRQEQTDNNDGMDLAVCRFDRTENGQVEMVYSGAKSTAYIGRTSNGEIEVLNPDRKSIGGYQPTKRTIEFTDQKIILNSGDSVFLSSDGIVDQNDRNRKKFGRARLKSILKDIIYEGSMEQKKFIEEKLDDFIQGEAQRDDITLAGIKII